MNNKKVGIAIATVSAVALLSAAIYGTYKFFKGRTKVLPGDDEDVVYVVLDDDKKNYKKKKAM